jgi:hypothetical protein
MIRKFITIALIVTIINLLGVASVFAGERSEKEMALAEKVRGNIEKLGTGERAKVKIILKDKSKIEGYISRTGENSFTVVSSENGRPAEVEYSQVKKAKGHNLSTGAKIAIGVGVGLAILAIIFLANRKAECQLCP